MKVLDLGNITKESLMRVKIAVKSSNVALSKNEIRARTGIPTSSLNRILNYYVGMGWFAKVETNSGTFYEWAEVTACLDN